MVNARRRSALSRFLRISLGLAVSGLSLYLALRQVHLEDVRSVFSQAEPGYVSLGLASVFVNNLVKIWRWKILLSPAEHRIDSMKVARSFLVAQLLNNFFPLRVGEISRVVVIGGVGGEQAFVLGTVVVEKILDMLAYAFLFLLLLLLIPLPGWIGGSGYAFVAATVLISVVVFGVTFQRHRVIEMIDRLLRGAPEQWRSWVSRYAQQGLASLDILRRYSDLLLLSVSTALVWTTSVLTNHLVLQALNIQAPITASLLVLIVLQAGISIPSLPGKIGIFEFSCVLSLGFFGVGQTAALSYGILLHVVVYLPILALGLPALWLFQASPASSKDLTT